MMFCPLTTVTRTHMLTQYIPVNLKKDTTDYQTSVSYLDVLLEKDVNGNLLTKLYDKRDIPSSPAYWVCVTQHALHTNNEQGDVLLKTSCWNKNIKTSIKIIIYML